MTDLAQDVHRIADALEQILAELLGHQDVQTTRSWYAEVPRSALVSAMRGIDEARALPRLAPAASESAPTTAPTGRR